MTSLRALVLTCLAGPVVAAREELDPWNFRDLELYVFAGSPPRCFQIFPGGRLAKGVPNIGTTSSECQRNWQEDTDLGNFDGYKSEEFGQHYSGGSTRGCSTWLRMFVDGSLEELQGTDTLERTDDTCDEYITLIGPESVFVSKEDQAAAAQQPAGNAPAAAASLRSIPAAAASLRSIHDSAAPHTLQGNFASTQAAQSGGFNSVPLVLLFIFGGAAVGYYFYRKSNTRRNILSDIAE